MSEYVYGVGVGVGGGGMDARVGMWVWQGELVYLRRLVRKRRC